MLTKVIFGSVLSLALVFTAIGFADWNEATNDMPADEVQVASCCATQTAQATADRTDCCKKNLACCDKGKTKACCVATAKIGCCAKGMKCCETNAACCSSVQECCREGAACCNENKACCGKASH